MSPMRIAVGLSGALLAAGASRALAQSCAMCGTALADDPLGRAFSWSILFLMAAPYTIFGTIAGWIFFTYRRALGRRRAAVIDLAETGRRTRRPTGGEETGGDIP